MQKAKTGYNIDVGPRIKIYLLKNSFFSTDTMFQISVSLVILVNLEFLRQIGGRVYALILASP